MPVPFHTVPTPAQTARHAAVRAFYVDVAVEAIALAERWGRRAHWRERAATLAGRTAPSMPDALLFPVLAGLSACARWVPTTAALAAGTREPAGKAAGAPTTDAHWTVRPPEGFDEPAFMDAMLALVREKPWRGNVDAFGRDGGACLMTPLLCCEQLARLGWVPGRQATSDDGHPPASSRSSLSRRWQPPATRQG